ncbi:MAG: efflux RND transporter periplasmic adaptor subunit [Planctomycetota bacterium]|nr:efflux RND transporter periplasmic adaptor subunit [Planctomycetota bacterium]
MRGYLPQTLFIGMLTLTVAGQGCAKKHETVPPGPPKVTVVTPVQRMVRNYEYFTGRTDALYSVDLQARVTGYLTEIRFKPGQIVKKNDVLFKIDPRPYQATLDQAKAQVLLTEAQLTLAKADYQRALEVSKTPGAMSQQDLDKYFAMQGQADAAVKAAQANVEAAQLNLDFTDVTSPIDGQVSRNLLDIGNLVRGDGTLLTTIVDSDQIYTYFDIDELTLLEVLELLRAGKIKGYTDHKTPVDIGLATEADKYPHEGFVDFVNTQVDPLTGTIQVRGVFENNSPAPGIPQLLKPGMFVRVRLQIGPPYEALIIPQTAIAANQSVHYVLTVNNENIAQYCPITLGPQQPNGMQVVIPVKMVKDGKTIRPAAEGETGFDSLKATDRVIVAGMRAQPGMPVSIKTGTVEDNSAASGGAATPKDVSPTKTAPATSPKPSPEKAAPADPAKKTPPAADSDPLKTSQSSSEPPQPVAEDSQSIPPTGSLGDSAAEDLSTRPVERSVAEGPAKLLTAPAALQLTSPGLTQ